MSRLPIHDIHVDTANDHPVAETTILDEYDLERIAQQIVDAFSDQPETALRMLERLPLTEPFDRNADAARRIVERLLP